MLARNFDGFVYIGWLLYVKHFPYPDSIRETVSSVAVFDNVIVWQYGASKKH